MDREFPNTGARCLGAAKLCSQGPSPRSGEPAPPLGVGQGVPGRRVHQPDFDEAFYVVGELIFQLRGELGTLAVSQVFIHCPQIDAAGAVR